MTIATLVASMAAAGALAGVLAGLLGVGGGIVIVPALATLFAFLNVVDSELMKVAVGTSLATIIATSISSMRAHDKRGSLDWSLLKVWGPSVAVGVVVGAYLAKIVHGDVLGGVFAVVALLAAAHLMFTPEGARLREGLPGDPWRAGIGGVIGMVSSMMGIGGGTLSVPTMTLCNIPVKTAVGTSSGIGLVIAVMGTASMIVFGWGTEDLPPFSIGYVNVLGFLVIVPMTVMFAPLGARLAHALPGVVVKRLFATFLIIVAARFLWKLFA